MVSIDDIRRLVRPLAGRVKGMIRRASLSALQTDTLAQSVQVGTTHDDTDDAVELLEQYGFTSGPPAGSEGIVLRVGGERAGSVALCFGDRRVRLQGVGQGEVAVYDDQGVSIVLRRDGNIEVTPGDGGTVQLGGSDAVLAVARETDPVQAATNLQTWITAVDTAIGAIAGILQASPSGTPVVTVEGAITVTAGVTPTGDIANISAGGEGSTST